MQMLKYSFQAMVVVICIALLTGLIGLALGYIQVDQSTIGAYIQWVRPGVNDPIQFVRVGFMHMPTIWGAQRDLLLVWPICFGKSA